MTRSIQKVLALLGVATLVLLVTASPASSLQSGGSMTIDDTTDLENGDTINITITGAEVSVSAVDILLCLADAATSAGCFGAASGNVAVEFGAGGGPFTVLNVPPDCRTSGCVYIAVDSDPSTLDGTPPCTINATTGAINCSTSPSRIPVTFLQLPVTTTTQPPVTTTTIAPVVPEAPLNILLPIGAATVLGLGTVVAMRRRGASAAV